MEHWRRTATTSSCQKAEKSELTHRKHDFDNYELGLTSCVNYGKVVRARPTALDWLTLRLLFESLLTTLAFAGSLAFLDAHGTAGQNCLGPPAACMLLFLAPRSMWHPKDETFLKGVKPKIT